MSLPYHGTEQCIVTKCANKAYYSTDTGIKCGVHSRKVKRVALPKMPKEIAAAEERLQLERDKQGIELARLENARMGVKGRVIVTKLRIMKPVEHHEGFLKVFPNNKHQNRKDGFGCASLSPMRLGPVVHQNPSLPHACNIENFHQGSKCFKEEMIEVDGKLEVGPKYFENRELWFKDPTPHRHKYQGSDPVNRNIPQFFGWTDKDGTLHQLNYIESRQFYCTFYERLTQQNTDLQKLRDMLDQGINLQIVGYDGRNVEGLDIESVYLDPAFPFGHELVLYTLLTHRPEDYPWRKHKTHDF